MEMNERQTKGLSFGLLPAELVTGIANGAQGTVKSSESHGIYFSGKRRSRRFSDDILKITWNL